MTRPHHWRQIKPLFARRTAQFGRGENAVTALPGLGRRWCRIGFDRRRFHRCGGLRLRRCRFVHFARNGRIRLLHSDNRQRRAHGHLVPGLGKGCCQIAVMACGHFDRAFVCLYLEQNVVSRHKFPKGLVPYDQNAAILRHAKLRHGHVASFWQRVGRRRRAIPAPVGGVRYPRNRLPHRHILPFGRCDMGQIAAGLGFHLHRGFVGFDFEQRIALGNLVTRRFQPGHDLARILCHAQLGHCHVMRHGSTPPRIACGRSPPPVRAWAQSDLPARG